MGIMLSKFWSEKFFILDLYKFELKYAKTPTEKFTSIPLWKVIDIIAT